MANINKLELNQIVYDVQRQKMGNTTIRIGRLFTVKIIEIAPDKSYVIASWNNNSPRKYYSTQIKKWKTSEPKPKTKIFGHNSY